jgi:hypothetical protein
LAILHAEADFIVERTNPMAPQSSRYPVRPVTLGGVVPVTSPEEGDNVQAAQPANVHPCQLESAYPSQLDSVGMSEPDRQTFAASGL